MSDKPWKRFEREAAALFGLTRCWANSGEDLDFPDKEEQDKATAVGQCKEVSKLSLSALTDLAEHVGQRASEWDELPFTQDKIGVVCVKVRRGRGRPSQPLVVMTFEQFERLIDMDIAQAVKQARRAD